MSGEIKKRKFSPVCIIGGDEKDLGLLEQEYPYAKSDTIGEVNGRKYKKEFENDFHFSNSYKTIYITITPRWVYIVDD